MTPESAHQSPAVFSSHASVRHLVGRFAASIVPTPVRSRDVEWTASVLAPAELELWQRMGRADRVESLRVARRAARELEARRVGDETARRDWIAVALLHDVGKLDARLGPYRRAVATVAGRLMPEMTKAWRSTRGFARRVALYLDHADLGATRIRVVGGREVAAQWAAVHHVPERWATDAPGVPIEVCEILARADGETVRGASSPSLGDRGGAAR